MIKHKASLNVPELLFTVFVPTLALAAYLAHKGSSLTDLRSIAAAGFLGVVVTLAHYLVVRWLQQSTLREEVFIRASLRVALSLGLGVAVGKLFVG